MVCDTNEGFMDVGVGESLDFLLRIVGLFEDFVEGFDVVIE